MSAIEIGISTSCFYPERTEVAVRHLSEMGIDCMEVFLNADSELSGPCFDEIRRTLAAGKTRVASVHPFTSGFESVLFFSDYERRFEDALEYYKRFFQATAALEARYMVIHGGRAEHHIPEERYFERYLRLAQTARSFGIRIVHENVNWCMGRSPEFLARMRKALGEEALFVLDLKQAIRAGVDYHEFFRLLGEAIRHIHISDHDEKRDCLLPGKGIMKLEEFFRELAEYEYNGSVILELYRQNYDNYGELFDSCRLLKAAAARIR